MSDAAPPAGWTYEVTLSGRLDAALRATCARLGVEEAQVVSRFLLAVTEGEGVGDVVRRLQARRLVVLTVRPVS